MSSKWWGKCGGVTHPKGGYGVPCYDIAINYSLVYYVTGLIYQNDSQDGGDLIVESNKKNNRPLLIGILIAVGLNLFLTFVIFVLILPMVANDGKYDLGGRLPLPEELDSEEEREELLSDFMRRYNDSDSDQLYGFISKAYRLQVAEDDFQQTVVNLKVLAPSLEDGAYESFEVQEFPNGQVAYRLNYSVSTPLGPRRVIINTVKKGEMKLEIYGFKIDTP